MISVRNVAEADLEALARMYVTIYEVVNPTEKWTVESARAFVCYFYLACKDLFFVVEQDGKLSGAAWGQVKPWWNGNRMFNFEVFIDTRSQSKGLSKPLLLRLFQQAKRKYKVNTIEVITFSDRAFPLSYYLKLSIASAEQLVLLEGDVSNIVKALQS